MRCHYNLINLPFNFVPFEVRKDDPLNENGMLEKTINQNDLINHNKDFLDWIHKQDLTLQPGRYFESAPNCQYLLHRDTYDLKNINVDLVKFNFVFDSVGTKMSWYKTNPLYEGEVFTNVLKDPMIKYDRKKCKVIYTTPVDSHCMINGGVIHDLMNFSNFGRNRRCYSFIINNLSWNQAVEKFSDYLKV